MIDTARLTLRPWTRDDVEPFIRHTNTPAVMRWLGGVKTADALESIVLDRFMLWERRHGHSFWVVERKGDGAFLGFCGLKIADDPASPVEGETEIGWRLREDAWGQGYAREAATATLDFAFGALGKARVIALTVAGNTPSWGLMERLGMIRRPELDYEGPAWAEGSVIVYSIGREEWRV